MVVSDDLQRSVRGCFNPRFIVNKYTGQQIRVNCGHCAYCRSLAAYKGASLCNSQSAVSKYTYFITLTYADEYVPKCRIQHLASLDDSDKYLSIDYQISPDFVPHKTELNYTRQFISSFEKIQSLFEKVSLSNNENNSIKDFFIPVLRKRDVQLFMKRLRQYLAKNTDVYDKLHTYIVGEYGPVHFRPHFHLLLFFDSPEFAQILTQAVSSCWTFGRVDCQASRGHCSRYVASYINSYANLPHLYLEIKAIKPFSRHSYFLGEGIFHELDSDARNSIQEHTNVQGFDELSDKFTRGVSFFDSKGISKIYPWRSYLSRLFPSFGLHLYRNRSEIQSIFRDVSEIPRILGKFGIVTAQTAMSEAKSLYHILKMNLHYARRENYITSHCYSVLLRLYHYSRFARYVSAPSEKGTLAIYRLIRSVRNCLRYFDVPDTFCISCSNYIDRIVNCMTSFFSARQKLSLCSQLKAQQDYKDYDNNLDSFNSYKSYIYTFDKETFKKSQSNSLVSQFLISASLKAELSVKHKKLNDANKIFCYI